MSNASRNVPRPVSSQTRVVNRDEFVEPYAHCGSNEAKLAAHLNAMLERSTELLRSNIDSPYEDVNATLANADYFRRMIADKTVTLPYCSNAVKFYSLLGCSDPGAFHSKLVKATHETLGKAWNQYTARKTIRTGEGFVRYVKKPHHLAELHDPHAFDHMIKKSVVKSSLLPPVRPPASHASKSTKVGLYDEMPELKPIAGEDDEMLLEGPFSRAKESLSRKRDEAARTAVLKAEKELKTAERALASARSEREKDAAEFAVKKAEQKLAKAKANAGRRGVEGEIDNDLSFEEEEMPIEGLFNRRREKKDKKKKKRVSGEFDDLSFDEDEDVPPLGAAISIDCHHDKKKHHHHEEEVESRLRDLSFEDDDEMPALRPIQSAMPKLRPIQAKSEPELKAVTWLRQCIEAKDNSKIKLQAGKTYAYFAPSDAQISRLVEHFSKPGKTLSKERVVSTHLAPHPGGVARNFQTLSGIKVEKDQYDIVSPAVANPRIETDGNGKVASLSIAGARVYILPHNNLFQ